MREVSELRRKVRDAYSAAALYPGEKHAFPVGRGFARSLGYPAGLLAELPPACVEAFAGVSDVSLFAEIPKGSAILDLGCGAGLDSLIAADRTELEGRVVGIDFSFSMLSRARQSAAEAGMSNVVCCHADAESLPLRDESIGIVLVNGIFNLNSVPLADARGSDTLARGSLCRGADTRLSIFRELGRVVRRGGVIYAAELILKEPLPPEQQTSESNWFA
jgi:arsenite methyltransferase